MGFPFLPGTRSARRPTPPGRGHYGNYIRLPGRHHKRPHWSHLSGTGINTTAMDIARLGQMLPPYDSIATLGDLTALAAMGRPLPVHGVYREPAVGP